MELFWRIFDSVLLLIGLAYIFIRYINPFFAQRKKDIELSIEKAIEAEKQAEELYKDAQNRLSEVKKEIEEIKKEALKEAEIEKTRIIEEAKASAGKILENYLTLAKSEIDKQKRELYQEALDMSFKVARDITNRELKGEVLDKVNDNLLKLSGEAIVR
ncbi:MAG: ATP synthase F0 subunit B [Deltaproteobacteria bacterium]|jgi:F-type H+-transporting ATPase subunit b|nr:ATP synthase F0 subunit B [Deltaproteobacteria bacterium]MCL5879624.1 ATP synthase F0 subunit B [Deltaproteobacteria bacterium]MDA8305021.1 ATP synthase F0 subunit B [Deltaproteobacteria bacterium]